MGPKEFLEFILTPLNVSSSEKEIVLEFINQLAEEIKSHPKVVCHYDFISHNIHLLEDGSLGLIDFQDACLESPARDLHAILCDRGMDELLGEELLTSLYKDFFSKQKDPKTFRELYSEYAVHWDMRVSGRFTKLSKVDGRRKYGKWVLGTTARVLEGLKRLTSKFPRAGDLHEIVCKKLPESKELAERPDPLEFPPIQN